MKVLATALLLLPWAIYGKVSPYVLENGTAAFDANADMIFCLPDQNHCEVKYTYHLDLNNCFINTGGNIFPMEHGNFGCRNCKDGDIWSTFECDCDVWGSGSKKSIGFLDWRVSQLSPVLFSVDPTVNQLVPECFNISATLVATY